MQIWNPRKDKIQKHLFQDRTLQNVYTVILVLFLLPTGAAASLAACGNAPENGPATGSPSPAYSSRSEDHITPGNPALDTPSQNSTFRNDPSRNSTPQDTSPFRSVPYFQDDTGKSLQSHDGFLYGYWNGQLCRYNADTLDRHCYFSAASDQSGRFCIYKDHIFFLERPCTASLTGMDTCLYTADLNRQDRELLTMQVPNTTAEYSACNDFDDYYEIDIWDDIIYLISDNFRENIYYRLDEEFRSVTRAGESETLYGLLPDGYRAPLWYSRLPSLPYQMRHYGYLFLMDEAGNLAACDVESGRLERIDLPSDNISRQSVFLTNDALYCAEEAGSGQLLTTWYRISLDNLHSAEEWGQFPPMQGYTGDDIFHDESGAYFAIRERSAVNLYRIPWDGSGITLLYSRYLKGGEQFPGPSRGDPYLCYTDGDYFYFNDKMDSQCCVMRASLHENALEPQIVTVYYEDPMDGIGTYDTLDHTFTVKADMDGETENFSYHTIFTRFYLTGDTAGDHAVNTYLDNVYRDFQKELDSFETSYDSEDDFLPLPDGMGSYMQVTAWPCYLDDNYLGITIAEETYYSGGAHPNTWSEEYVFDRRTGKRLSITDIVENSPEEICEIAASYIERDHPGLHFHENPEYRAGILEDFRFFLSGEGIGIHYNTYELGSYVEGNEDYIIPFWEFDLKPDTVMYLNIEKVRYRPFLVGDKEAPSPRLYGRPGECADGTA